MQGAETQRHNTGDIYTPRHHSNPSRPIDNQPQPHTLLNSSYQHRDVSYDAQNLHRHYQHQHRHESALRWEGESSLCRQGDGESPASESHRGLPPGFPSRYSTSSAERNQARYDISQRNQHQEHSEIGRAATERSTGHKDESFSNREESIHGEESARLQNYRREEESGKVQDYRRVKSDKASPPPAWERGRVDSKVGPSPPPQLPSTPYAASDHRSSCPPPESGVDFSRSAMVTASPAQAEDPRKTAQRYSVDSYPPSPDDPNDPMDKSAMDDNDGMVDDDDEFSDGGHYRSPSSYHRYMRDASYDNGNASSPDREMEDGPKNGGNGDREPSIESLEIMKRRFFEQCLKNGGNPPVGYPMEYPLRGGLHPAQSSRDFGKGSSAMSEEMYSSRSRHEAAMKGFQGEGTDSSSQKLHPYMRHPNDPSRPYTEESGDRMAMYAADSRPSLDSQHHREGLLTPKKEPNTSFSPGKESAYPSSVAFPERREDPSAFSPIRDTPMVKREHQRGSPDSSPVQSRGDGGGMPPSSSSLPPSSSPLTKIPIPGALAGQLSRGGFPPGELNPMHEMMMAGGMGVGGPRLPMGPQMPERTGPPGHVYFCHLCSYSGSIKDDFDAHMQIHFEYNCPHCDYTSRTEGRLKRHIKDFHSDPDTKQRSMPGRPKIFRCKQCEFSCIDKVQFWAHARTHIKEEKLLACPRCPFVTEYKHHLEYHLRNHFGSKPYKCGKCNYSCVNKSMLNSHMKSHTNVYQYRCADCTYATKYCHSLKLHLRKYNHKPATVLNSDGSLPQGIDAEISGLSLLAKRGPPRGPRGMRKEKDGGEGGGFMPGFFPMPPSPHHPHRGLPPGFNPMMNGGMLPPSPYWPMMANGMHPPPPLIPLGGPHPGMEKPEGHNGPGPSPRSAEHEMRRRELENSGGREAGDFLCRMCSFATESPEALHAHVFKVHASENRDLLNMLPFNISSDALMGGEDAAQKMHSRRMSAPPASSCATASQSLSPHDLDPESYPRRNTVPSGQSPLKSRGEHGGSPWARKRELFPGYLDNMYLGQQGGGDRDRRDAAERSARQPHQPAEEGADILRQMTLKFGAASSSVTQSSVSAAAMSVAASIAAMATKQGEQGALDLTNKTASPPLPYIPPSLFPPHSSHPDAPFPYPALSAAGEKRPIAEVSASTNSGEENNCFGSNEDTPSQPRKRSRKGKAYKLDALYHKRQAEHQQQQELEEQQQQRAALSSEHSDSQDAVSPAETITEGKEESKSEEDLPSRDEEAEKMEGDDKDDTAKSSPVPEEEADRFRQLQKEIRMLNSEVMPENAEDNDDSGNQQPPSPDGQSNADGPCSNQASPQQDASSPPPQDGEAAEGDSEMTEEDHEQERESTIKAIYQSRRQPANQAVRRGTELAWKIMTDPSTGVDLPPGTPPRSEEDRSQISLPSSASPPKNGMGGRNMHGSVDGPGYKSPLSSPTSHRNGMNKNSFPVSLSSSSASMMNPYAGFMSFQEAARNMTTSSSPSGPERLSTHAQTVPPFRSPMMDMMFAGKSPLAPRPPPPPARHQFECEHCDMGFKDMMMYSMHMAYHNEAGNPFQCRGCGYSCQDKREFFLHIVQNPHS